MSYKTSSRIQWIALLALGLGFSLIFLDSSALNIALPFIQKDLSTSTAGLFWVVNAYVLAVAAFALAGGRIADIWGLRRTFLAGLVLFGLASIACALSYSVYFLIGARVFQGIGGAATLATSTTIIYHIFPEETRGKAMGIFGLSAVVFVVIGPVLGGFFTQFATWRWIFWINPMVGAVSFAIIYILLKGLDRERDHEATFDYLGQILLM